MTRAKSRDPQTATSDSELSFLKDYSMSRVIPRILFITVFYLNFPKSIAPFWAVVAMERFTSDAPAEVMTQELSVGMASRDRKSVV